MTKLLMTPRFVAALQSVATAFLFILLFFRLNLSSNSSTGIRLVDYLFLILTAYFFIYALLLWLRKTPVSSNFSPPVRIFATGFLIGLVCMMFIDYWTEIVEREREETETVMQLDQN